MKGHWRSAAVLTASVLAGSSPLHAHEDCDDILRNSALLWRAAKAWAHVPSRQPR
jgi:hypothetical protein